MATAGYSEQGAEYAEEENEYDDGQEGEVQDEYTAEASAQAHTPKA